MIRRLTSCGQRGSSTTHLINTTRCTGEAGPIASSKRSTPCTAGRMTNSGSPGLLLSGFDEAWTTASTPSTALSYALGYISLDRRGPHKCHVFHYRILDSIGKTLNVLALLRVANSCTNFEACSGKATHNVPGCEWRSAIACATYEPTPPEAPVTRTVPP